MIFYEIELLGIPTIHFACSVDTKTHYNRFSNIPRFLELALNEEGGILWHCADGSEKIIEPGMFNVITCNSNAVTEMYGGNRQRHTTVGVFVDYNINICTSEKVDLNELKNRMTDKSVILIPEYADLEEYWDPVMKELKQIISYHNSLTPFDKYSAVSHWFQLVKLLSEFVLKQLEQPKLLATPAEYFYAERAKQYIRTHYSEPLTVEGIATHLGISKGYLHRVFKKTNNGSVSECINRHRIQAAITLIEYKHVSLQEAAFNVGIDDPSYMSRLF